MDITNFAVTQTMAVAVIVGLEQVIRRFKVKEYLIPLFDIILGSIVGIYFFSEQGIKYGVIIGVIMGLEACGLFGSIQNCSTCNKNKEDTSGREDG